MSFEKLTSLQSELSPPDQEALTVTMDIGLGETFSSIDVDIEQLTHTLRKIGMSDSVVSRERIHFATPDFPDEAVRELHEKKATVLYLGGLAWTHVTSSTAITRLSAKERNSALSDAVSHKIIHDKGARIPGYTPIDLDLNDPMVKLELRYGDYYHLGHTENDAGISDYYKIPAANKEEKMTEVSVYGGIRNLSKTEMTHEDGPLVRLHSECRYGEVFGSEDCDCKAQLKTATERIINEKQGILFYLRQEGRGAGLLTKARGHVLGNEEGLNTVEAYERMGVEFDSRKYGHAVEFLLAYGITKVRLMSNNPKKIKPLIDAGIRVTRIPLVILHEASRKYMRAKRDGDGHLLPPDL